MQRIKLDKITITHNLCGTIMVVYEDNNHACNDPECCGEYEEYYRIHCEKCDYWDDLRP